MTFFPFVGNEVEFPAPVSNRLFRAFQNKCFTKTKDIHFRNISENVPLYDGRNIALSYGGGIDSTAVRHMFPEAFIIHEAHIRNGELLPSLTHKIVRDLPQTRGRLVTSNIRYLSEPGGWHTWPCATSTSLLMATDFKIGVILTGSNLGSSFVSNGARFWDRLRARAWHGPAGNYWQSAFYEIGLPMVSPVTGVSELQTMKLSKWFLDNQEVIYCMRNGGDACHRCSKCFRRDVVKAFIFDGYTVEWDMYAIDSIRQFLKKRPLYFGHIFSTCFSLKPWRYPNWILDLVRDVQPVRRDWAMRVFADSFQLFPEKWARMISERVLQHVEPMSREDIQEFKSWDQSRN